MSTSVVVGGKKKGDKEGWGKTREKGNCWCCLKTMMVMVQNRLVSMMLIVVVVVVVERLVDNPKGGMKEKKS